MSEAPSLLIELLEPWIRVQRWFPAKDESGAAIRVLSSTDLADPAGQASCTVLIIAVDRGAGTTLVQVPLVTTPIVPARPGAEPESEPTGLIATLAGDRALIDGPHHPAFVRAWLAAAETDLAEIAQPSADGGPGVDAPDPVAEAVVADVSAAATGARVLTGEQSNTSVLLPAAGAILKVFRVLAAGPNPDIDVTRALHNSGWSQVPAPLGWSAGRWPDPAGSGTPQQGYLGVLTAFVPDARDGFDLLCERAGTGADVTDLVHDLGVTVADMHEHLRTSLPVHDPRSPAARAGDLAAAMRQRATWALDTVPELAPFTDAIDELITGVAAMESVPSVQRIHGDLHLGQTLRSGAGGGDAAAGSAAVDARPDRAHEAGSTAPAWYVIDFEGEPLRPLAQRTRPDQPLRDLAGMLRSLDYAAAVGGAPGEDWTSAARAALLAGYIEGGNNSAAQREAVDDERDLRTGGTLVRALELDKALYEAVYEYQNRPDWLSIPLRGIRRITEEHAMTFPPDDDAVGAPLSIPVEAALDAPPAAVPGTAAGAPDEATTAPSDADDDGEPTPSITDRDLLGIVAHGEHFAPHDILGPHLDAERGIVTIRTVRHLATAVTIVTPDGRHEARHEDFGVWVLALRADEVPDYRVEVIYEAGPVRTDDPYRFLPTLGEVDQHLIREGRHEQLWDVLGAHVRTFGSVLGEVRGVSFSVWAPNARAVRVVGDFNGWDGRSSSMRSLGSSGVWELFLPDVSDGARYKFELCHADGSWHTKADPMARAAEVPPATASVVTVSDYTWADEDWMAARAAQDPHNGPMSVYEVHLGSWRPGLSYVELADQLVGYVTWMGFTHVELMPVAEHPFGGSWGYQVTSYYAPTSRFGSPDEFRHLVDALHQAGIGVILDWVPAHFPKDEWALAAFDGTALYEHPDPMRGEQKDWGTLVFNFGRNEVRNFLVANALYWLTEFHIDGLRVDAVASMLYLDYSREPGQWRPNERGGRENLEAIQFLQETNATAYRVAPGIVMIAEESTAWPGVTAPTDHGGLGFGLKWNMGWMNDTLRYLAEQPINRRYHHGELTFSLVYAFSERFVLPISHDEVVHGKGSLWQKMPGDLWQKLAGVRTLFAYQWSHPGKNLMFMGGEFAQNREWNEGAGLEWGLGDTPPHAGVRLALRALNQVYRDNPALWHEDHTYHGFEWLEANDGDHNVLAYLRKDGEDHVAVLVNFAGSGHQSYRLGLPHGGDWTEILNTDDPSFGGSGVLNPGTLTAEDVPWHGRSHSVLIEVPPLGAIFLKPATS
ncbi:1,4-alpha-glucan branching protein GlgB [Occultella aeris]|uniref:1,4-alpha-glucan branching enzyme GlgB n=1 Tax=Occultella aeris TaxID=2761496 RepID=A0A7M4DMS2_9MICO|nr:1,4-alpha-glucan branching protein GlgB [Occultella aeris]VZO38717.1 1,4-alpha-glucan branching enzyme GlgB [Occultella aeris]